MANKILWLKWRDPFLARKLKWDAKAAEEEDLELTEAHDLFEEAEEEDEEELDDVKTGPGLIGPWGVIPLSEHNVPSRNFNFWIGHTNFPITSAIRDAIANIAGVETLDVFTRYRFRLGVGKVFDAAEVRNKIDEAMNARPKKDKR